MIRKVPTPKLPNSSFEILQPSSDLDPTHSLTSQIDFTENFDFDLGLLPSAECEQLPLSPPSEDFNDFFATVPSPSDPQSCLSPNLTTDLDQNLTMFSPENSSKFGLEKNFLAASPLASPPCYVPSASPAASVTSSCPYSPAPRTFTTRFSSTDSYSASPNSTLNLKEGLDELAQLQKSVKNDLLDYVDLELLEQTMFEEIKMKCSELNLSAGKHFLNAGEFF